MMPLSPYVPLRRFKRQNLCLPLPPSLQSGAQPAAEISARSALVPLLFSCKSAESRQGSHQLLASRFAPPPGTGDAPTCILSSACFISLRGLTYTSFFCFSFCRKLHLGSARVTWAPARQGARCFSSAPSLQGGLRALGKHGSES